MTIFKSKRKVLNNFFVIFLLKELKPKTFNTAYIVFIHKIRLVTIYVSNKKVLNKNCVRLLFKEIEPDIIYLLNKIYDNCQNI